MSTSRLLFIAFTSLLATACGGKLEGTVDSTDPTEESGVGPVGSVTSEDGGTGNSTTTVSFPQGTIAAGTLGAGITFYPPGAATGTAPIGTLAWDPAPYVPQYMAFDANGTLYVDAYLFGTNDPSLPTARIDVFAPGTIGANPTPSRTIMGPATGLVSARGMRVVQGAVYVANAVVTGSSASGVLVFQLGTSGNVAPLYAFESTRPEGLWLPSGLAVDWAGDILVADSEGSAIQSFQGPLNGVRNPGWLIGADYVARDPTALALDSQDHLYEADSVANDVLVFSTAGNVDAGPPSSIGGPATGLTAVTDVAVDAQDRICVANGAGGLAIFAPGTEGDVAPVAVLTQPAKTYNVAVVP